MPGMTGRGSALAQLLPGSGLGPQHIEHVVKDMGAIYRRGDADSTLAGGHNPRLGVAPRCGAVDLRLVCRRSSARVLGRASPATRGSSATDSASCLANAILTRRSAPDDRRPDARPPAWDAGHRCARAVVAPHAQPHVRHATLAGRTRPAPGLPARLLSPSL